MSGAQSQPIVVGGMSIAHAIMEQCAEGIKEMYSDERKECYKKAIEAKNNASITWLKWTKFAEQDSQSHDWVKTKSSQLKKLKADIERKTKYLNNLPRPKALVVGNFTPTAELIVSAGLIVHMYDSTNQEMQEGRRWLLNHRYNQLDGQMKEIKQLSSEDGAISLLTKVQAVIKERDNLLEQNNRINRQLKDFTGLGSEDQLKTLIHEHQDLDGDVAFLQKGLDDLTDLLPGEPQIKKGTPPSKMLKEIEEHSRVFCNLLRVSSARFENANTDQHRNVVGICRLGLDAIERIERKFQEVEASERSMARLLARLAENERLLVERENTLKRGEEAWKSSNDHLIEREKRLGEEEAKMEKRMKNNRSGRMDGVNELRMEQVEKLEKKTPAKEEISHLAKQQSITSQDILDIKSSLVAKFESISLEARQTERGEVIRALQDDIENKFKERELQAVEFIANRIEDKLDARLTVATENGRVQRMNEEIEGLTKRLALSESQKKDSSHLDINGRPVESQKKYLSHPDINGRPVDLEAYQTSDTNESKKRKLQETGQNTEVVFSPRPEDKWSAFLCKYMMNMGNIFPAQDENRDLLFIRIFQFFACKNGLDFWEDYIKEGDDDEKKLWRCLETIVLQGFDRAEPILGTGRCKVCEMRHKIECVQVCQEDGKMSARISILK